MSDDRAFDETLATLSDPPTSADGAAAYATGDVLATRYEVLACLGAGAMGEVYRVLDRQLDEVVALKRLTLSGHGEAAERFLREVKLGRRVTHRNVARTHDVGEHDGVLFLTMELVEGSTLEDVLEARGGVIPFPEATRLCRQVLEGLAAAHDAGIVHRDLKPANVLVDGEGRAVLTDFGIARASAEPALTRAQQLVGTPIYMAPEQVTGRPVDHRADLYAFGVMLFELVTGQWPFSGETAIELALARVTQEPVDPRSLGVPDLLAGVILRCLEREPSARPQSARDVLALLDGRATPMPLKPAAPLADAVMVESLAVLPFAYRGPSDDDYLGTGLAEELVDVLGRLRGIRVLAFSATYSLGPLADPIDVATRLAVGHVVAGSVQLRGRDVRITARLLDADGSQRWSERFSGELDDVFELQESMSQRIAEALRLELSTHSHGKLPREAVELYFRARRHILRDGYDAVDGPLADLEAVHRPRAGLHARVRPARGGLGAELVHGERHVVERRGGRTCARERAARAPRGPRAPRHTPGAWDSRLAGARPRRCVARVRARARARADLGARAVVPRVHSDGARAPRRGAASFSTRGRPRPDVDGVRAREPRASRVLRRGLARLREESRGLPSRIADDGPARFLEVRAALWSRDPAALARLGAASLRSPHALRPLVVALAKGTW
ncbi:MAG: protein kinase [Sandaracinus sp.]|nr:protein kinase [Sandaracinus sp.]